MKRFIIWSVLANTAAILLASPPMPFEMAQSPKQAQLTAAGNKPKAPTQNALQPPPAVTNTLSWAWDYSDPDASNVVFVVFQAAFLTPYSPTNTPGTNWQWVANVTNGNACTVLSPRTNNFYALVASNVVTHAMSSYPVQIQKP